MTDKATALAVERIDKARAELILAQTFYGVLVSNVEPVPSRQFPTMATNGKQHFFNPDFINGLPQEEVLGTQAHESEHDARRHHTRRGDRDPKKWNEACDFAINPDLIRAGFRLPKGALLDWKYEGLSAEDIYRTRELDRQQEQKQQQPQPQDGDTDDEADEADEDGDDETDGSDDAGDDTDEDGDDEADGQGDDEGDEDGDQGQGSGDGDEADDAGQGGQGDEPGDNEGQGAGEAAGEAGDDEGQGSGQGQGSDQEGAGEGQPASCGDPGQCGEVLDAAEEPAEIADQDSRWERVLRQAAMLAAKRGDAPGHVTREIARSDHPPQDWRETLRQWFDKGATRRETWARPNRRFIGAGLYLPGSERDGVNRVVVLVDTSGSMDDVALAAIEVETRAALDEGIIDELVVVYGDTRVTRVDTYRNGDEIEFDPRGGGGTVLAPLFQYVHDEIEDPSLIVCFTDGYIDDVTKHGAPPCDVLWAYTGYPTVVRGMIEKAPWGMPGIDVGAH